jgi:DNA polymerase III epsilon subunit-like protein
MIVVDIETTGTDPSRSAILSIGAVVFEEPSRQFFGECRAFEDAVIEPAALAVNGFSLEATRDPGKPTEAELVRSFLAWAADASNQTLMAHNPHFDIGFLKTASRRAGEKYALPVRSLDLHSVCFAHMRMHQITPPSEAGKSTLSSDAVMQYCGIPEEPKPHIALNGALWETEAFSRLLDNKSLLSEFAGYPIPWA